MAALDLSQSMAEDDLAIFDEEINRIERSISNFSPIKFRNLNFIIRFSLKMTEYILKRKSGEVR